jgi:hypothetical protein
MPDRPGDETQLRALRELKLQQPPGARNFRRRHPLLLLFELQLVANTSFNLVVDVTAIVPTSRIHNVDPCLQHASVHSFMLGAEEQWRHPDSHHGRYEHHCDCARKNVLKPYVPLWLGYRLRHSNVRVTHRLGILRHSKPRHRLSSVDYGIVSFRIQWLYPFLWRLYPARRARCQPESHRQQPVM